MSDDNERMIQIPERQLSGLMAQASFLRAALHALGGTYEVSFSTMEKHGSGPMELSGNPERKVIEAKLIKREIEELPTPRVYKPS